MAETNAASKDGVIQSLSVNRFSRLLERMGLVVQQMRGEDGKPAVRFMKLGIDGLALFFGQRDEEHYAVVVLQAYLAGAQPLDAVNAVNTRGILPKVYATKDNTVFELCIPVEAGLTLDAVAYYVRAFEAALLNAVTGAKPGGN